MIAYYLVPAICGSCGSPMLCVDKLPYNAHKKRGVVQVICAHRECPDYDKPMEFDLPQVELRPTTDKRILEMADAPRIAILN